MGRFLLFRIAFYAIAVGLAAFWYFGREDDEAASAPPAPTPRASASTADNPVLGAHELLGKTSKGLKVRMYLKSGQVTYFEIGLDMPCHNGQFSTNEWWNAWPEEGHRFTQVGDSFFASHRSSVTELGVKETTHESMRARIEDGGQRVVGTARAVTRFQHRRGTDRCDSGRVRFEVTR